MNAKAFGSWAAVAVASLAALACSEDKCSRGDPCEATCEAGQSGVCVVDGICRCSEAPDGGTGGAGGGQGGGMGNGGGVTPPAGCSAPVAGDLFINELQIDGAEEGEVDEFVEIYNRADHPIALGGLQVVSAPEGAPVDVTPADPTKRWTFLSGCIIANSAVAVFRKPEIHPPMSGSEPLQSVTTEYSGSGLSNTKAFDVRLLSGANQLDRFAGGTDTFGPGVSANRNPDNDPAGIAAEHSAVSANGLKNSPGRCANGGTFEAFCGDAPLPPDGGVGGSGGGGGMGGGGMNTGGTGGGGMNTGGMVVPPPVCETVAPAVPLVINEVYADPTESPEGNFEFIELVNAGPAAITLDGFSIWAPNGDNVLVPRYQFATGTLPGGGAVAIYGNLPPEQWIWDPAPAVMPTKAEESFSLVNDANPLAVVIKDQAGGEITRFEVPRALNVPGKSVNRCHDVDGTSPVLHDTLGDLATSPGKCSNGGLFSAQCVPPAPPGPPDPGSMP
jgi:hypothetical protein